jgi:hypothetical protein
MADAPAAEDDHRRAGTDFGLVEDRSDPGRHGTPDKAGGFQVGVLVEHHTGALVDDGMAGEGGQVRIVVERRAVA